VVLQGQRATATYANLCRNLPLHLLSFKQKSSPADPNDMRALLQYDQCAAFECSFTSVERSKGVPEIVLRNVASEDYPGHA
jgi:hypothetical protein